MKEVRVPALGTVVAVCLLPCAALARLDTEQPRRLDGGGRLDWVPCWFEPTFGDDARCAHFFPAPVPGEPPVRLPVVVLKSVLPNTRASPVLYLPPGPGSAVGLTDRGLEPWWHWQGVARWPHDVVLFDVRGAGAAEPRLDCPENVDADRAALARPFTADDDLRTLQDAAGRCHARLRAAGLDPRGFSTERHVRDVGELLALLGGTDWNLWGVSYGTRLALHVAREFPQRVRALVLDSAYPPEVNGLLAKPSQFAAIAPALAAVCTRDPACARAHPALRRQLDELLRRLAKQPATLEVEKWPGVWRHRLGLTDYRLLWLLFLEAYRPPERPRAPHAIARALDGDLAPLLPLAEAFVDALLDRDFSHGVYYATVCAEDLPGVSRATYLAEVRRHPSVARHVETEWDRHVCQRWEPAALPARYREPVRSALPALFLSGAHDIVTPPAWAAAAARGFRRGRHYTFAGSSHAVSWENGCAMEVVWEFLADPRKPATPECWQAEAAEARRRRLNPP